MLYSYRFILSLFIGITLSSIVHAQITGKITDKESRVLRGVHISVLGTDEGTYSDQNGRFSLDWTTFPVRIRFSSVGYKAVTYQFNQAQDSISIIMDEDLLGLGEVVINVDRFYNPFNRKSPVPRTTVDALAITSKPQSTAVELLRGEQGVFVQQTTVGQGSVYIRGRAGRDVLYLFNGLRMNPSFVRSGQNQYFGAIDAFAIKQLDVFRGPVSVFYGSDGLSGGINITPKSKEFSNEEVVSGEFNMGINIGGTRETTVNTQVSYQSPDLTLHIGGTTREFETYKVPNSSNKQLLFPLTRNLEITNYTFSAVNFTGKRKLTPSSNLTWASYYGALPSAPRIDRITLGFAIEDGVTTEPRSAFESNTDPLTFAAHSIGYEWLPKTPSINTLKLKAAFYKLRDDRRSIDFLEGFEPIFNTDPNLAVRDFERSDTTFFDRNRSHQYQLALDIESKLYSNLVLKWGLDYSYDYVTSRRTEETRRIVINRPLPRFPNGSQYTQAGIFGHLDHEVNNRLNLGYGVRYSYFFVDIPFEGIASNRGANPFEENFDQLTGSLSLSYGINERSTFVANFSNGFRTPNIADLSELGIRRSNELQTANTLLKPEKSFNIDSGIRHSGEMFSLELYGFWLHYFDRIRRVRTGNIVDVEGNVIRQTGQPQNADEFIEVTSVNEDALDILGIEYVSKASLNDYVKMGLTFTYNWGELTLVDGSKEPVDRIPPANGTFYIDYFAHRTLVLRPQFRYALAQRRISPAEIDDNRVSMDGTDAFVNVQLVTNWNPTENIGLRVVADNLTNAAYREHASSLDGLRRNITFAFRYKF